MKRSEADKLVHRQSESDSVSDQLIIIQCCTAGRDQAIGDSLAARDSDKDRMIGDRLASPPPLPREFECGMGRDSLSPGAGAV